MSELCKDVHTGGGGRSFYRNRTQRAIMLVAAFCLIASDNRCWISISTWMGGFGSVLGGGFVLLAGALLVVNLIREKTPLRADFLLPVFGFWLLIGTWARFGLDGSVVATRTIALSLPVYAILCLDRKDKIRLLYSLGIVFALFVGLAATFFVFRYFGIPFPGFDLESPNPLKVASGMHYEISYLGGAILNRYGNLTFCGVFDEAGCVGTFAALLFVALKECRDLDGVRFVRLVRVSILVEGVLSFSFAFVLLMLAYLAYYCIKRGNVKTAVLVACVAVAVFLIPNVDLQQLGSLGSLRTRIETLLGGDGLANNRVNEQTAIIMWDFYNTKDAFVSLFGYGQSSFYSIANRAGVDGCSVEFYLYDYGYVGFALYYAVLVMLNRCSRRSVSGGWILLLLFLLSTYQRPEVVSSLYFAILMLGNIPQPHPERTGRRGSFRAPSRLGSSRLAHKTHSCTKGDGIGICR